MRIGIPELEKYNPARGIGRYVTNLSHQWQKSGFEVIPLTSRTSSLPVLRNLHWGLTGNYHQLVDLIFWPNFLGAESLFFIRRRIPSIVTVHDVGGIDCSDDKTNSSWFSQALYRLALSALKRASVVTTDSDFTRQRLLHYFPTLTPKVKTVHLGIDLGTFSPRNRVQARRKAAKAGLPISADDFVLIYVGAEYARKNLGALIRAFALTKKSLPHAKLLKVGRSHSLTDRAHTLECLAEANLRPEQDIIFIEDVSDDFLVTLYSASDVFVSCSKYEGFGLPLLEALACGLPAVVGNIGSFPEVGGNAAFYTNPENPNEVAKTILSVSQMNYDKLQELSLRQARYFTWEKTASQMLQIMKAVACV